MKAIVTGAGGFIGSHLVDALYKEGHTVIALDRFSKGTAEHLAGKNGKRFRIFQADVTDYESIRPAFRGADWVFHLAARSGNPQSLVNPEEFHRVNVTGTVNVLQAAREAKVKKVVYAASSTCYADYGDKPIPEDASIMLSTPYSLTKYLAEQYVLHWGRVYQLPVISLRLFLVYGPKSRPSGTYGPLITMFLNQVKNTGRAMVNGDGSQSRDLVYVSDITRAFIQAAKSQVTGEIFNIGSGEHITLNRMLELLSIKVGHKATSSWEIHDSYPDISKAIKTFNWQPEITPEKGIRMLDDLASGSRDSRFSADLSGLTTAYYLTGPATKTISQPDISFIRQKAKISPLGRARICLHPDMKNPLQEMIIAITKKTYVRPHKHKKGIETTQIIHGDLLIVVFTDSGKIDEKIILSASKNNGTLITRIPGNIYHTQIPLTPEVVIHEVNNGNFRKDKAIFPDWAPDGTDPKTTKAYINKIIKAADTNKK